MRCACVYARSDWARVVGGLDPIANRSMTSLSLNRLFFFAAALCFAVALLLALGVFTGGNAVAWTDGGLLSLALGFALP